MLELYKRMYATLVGIMDQSICDLTNIALLEDCDKYKILKVAENMQKGLQKVEDMYLDAEDEEEGEEEQKS